MLNRNPMIFVKCTPIQRGALVDRLHFLAQEIQDGKVGVAQDEKENSIGIYILTASLDAETIARIGTVVDAWRTAQATRAPATGGLVPAP